MAVSPVWMCVLIISVLLAMAPAHAHQNVGPVGDRPGEQNNSGNEVMTTMPAPVMEPEQPSVTRKGARRSIIVVMLSCSGSMAVKNYLKEWHYEYCLRR